MKKNFKAVDIAIIKFNDIEIDIHNELLLDRINVIASDGRLDLFWSREEPGDKVFAMSFTGVSRYIISNRNLLENGDDSRTLDSIGYLPPDEFGKSDVFMMEKEFADDYHIILCFVDDSYISIEASTCAVEYIENVVKCVV